MKNKFIYIFTVFCFLLCFQISFASTPKTFKVGAFDNYPVIFIDTDGIAKGLYVDLLTEISKRENINFEYVFGTWIEGLDRIKVGEVDMLTSVGRTEERKQFMDYTENPILTVWGELYSLSSSKINSILDVSQKKIGILSSDINAINFKELLSQFDINCDFIEFMSYGEVFSAIADGRVDAGIAGITFGSANKTTYGLKSTGIVFNPLNLYFTVSKGQNPDLLKILDKHLLSWKNEENLFFEQIRQKWFYGSISATTIMPPWVINLLIIFGVILLTSFIFITLLRKQVSREVGRVKEKDKLLVEINNIFSLFLRYSPFYTYIKEVTPTGSRVVQASDNFSQMVGLPGSNLIGKTMEDIFPPNFAEKINMDDRSVLEKGEVVRLEEELNGRYYNSLKFPIINNGKKLIAGYTIDITDEKKKSDEREKIEKKLIESNRELDLALKSAKMGVWIFNTSLNKRIFDTQVCRLLDLNPLTFKGTPEEFYNRVHPDDQERIKKALENTINKGVLYSPDYRVVWRDGSVHWVSVRGELIKSDNSNSKIINGIMWEITEQKRTESELSKYREGLENLVKERTIELNEEKIKAEIANRAKADFLSNVSHEMRTPLTAILGFSQMIYDQLLGPINDKQKESLLDVLNSGKHLLAIVEDILDISAIESGKIKLFISEFSLHDLIKNAEIIVRDKAIDKKIKLSMMCSTNIGMIKTDKRKVKQILFNLLSNSVKFTQEGGQIDISVRKSVDAVDVIPENIKQKVNLESSIIFSVKDNGIGINNTDKERIFVKFTQLESPLVKTQPGLGLGLSLSRELARALGGDLWFTSEGKNRGSNFFFILPINN